MANDVCDKSERTCYEGAFGDSPETAQWLESLRVLLVPEEFCSERELVGCLSRDRAVMRDIHVISARVLRLERPFGDSP